MFERGMRTGLDLKCCRNPDLDTTVQVGFLHECGPAASISPQQQLFTIEISCTKTVVLAKSVWSLAVPPQKKSKKSFQKYKKKKKLYIYIMQSILLHTWVPFQEFLSVYISLWHVVTPTQDAWRTNSPFLTGTCHGANVLAPIHHCLLKQFSKPFPASYVPSPGGLEQTGDLRRDWMALPSLLALYVCNTNSSICFVFC